MLFGFKVDRRERERVRAVDEGAGKTSLMSRLLQLMDVLHAMHGDDWAQEEAEPKSEQLGRNEDDTKHVLCLLNFVEQVLRHPKQK